MLLTDIYDNQGQDGKDNIEAFEKMPKILQYFISSQQKLITDKIRRAVEKKYGHSGVADLHKTSGFRSVITNARHNGVSDSLHLWGCACDFAKNGIFAKQSIPVCCDLQVIDSGDCWHVQIKRG